LSALAGGKLYRVSRQISKSQRLTACDAFGAQAVLRFTTALRQPLGCEAVPLGFLRCGSPVQCRTAAVLLLFL
jgi:hypothetical protein